MAKGNAMKYKTNNVKVGSEINYILLAGSLLWLNFVFINLRIYFITCAF